MGPSWCHYQSGPWPVPHDTLVNFETTVPGYEWLDRFGAKAADQILANRNGAPVVVGHADWYAGNTVVTDGKLVGTYDWELVADTEAVIAGFAAACYAQRQTSAGNLSGPEEVAAFMRDYDAARAEPLSEPNNAQRPQRPPGSVPSPLDGRSRCSRTTEATTTRT